METIPNPKRGCGHLKDDSMYLRAEPGDMGILPQFVSFVQPIPYDGQHFRSAKKFNGLLWDMMNQCRTDPIMELTEYLKRINGHLVDKHIIPIGYDLSAKAFDLLMWVGKDYYPQPSDFINECKKHGICKRIKKGAAPAIFPGFTRLFIIHPHGHGEDQPAVIGYSYLTRAIYTQPIKKPIPKWVQDMANLEQVSIVNIAGKTTSGARTREIGMSDEDEW